MKGRVMKTSVLLVLGLVAAVVAGCVVAPIPAGEAGAAAGSGVAGPAAPESNLTEGVYRDF